MRAAGCVVNDLWDRDIDRMVARTAGRPLASGALRPRQALVFLAVLLLAGLAILLQLNGLAQALGAASLLLVALYPLAKRVTWWPQLVMGFTFGFGAPLGYAAGAGRVDAAWAALYGAAILWDLGFDTIYAHQDREDDALVGVKSTARLFGERTAPFLAACYGGTVLLLVAGRLARRAGRLVLSGADAAGGPAGAAGRRAGHRRSGAVPAAVQGEPRGWVWRWPRRYWRDGRDAVAAPACRRGRRAFIRDDQHCSGSRSSRP